MGPFERFFELAHQRYREQGTWGLWLAIAETGNWIRSRTTERLFHRLARRGSQNVYEREWDVLILLDCARVDMMEQVRDEYDYLCEIDEHVSPGTTSGEWMEYTFTEAYREEMADTVYVTANTHSAEHLNADEFRHLEAVWRDGWDDVYKTILPRTVTDRAIALPRELNPRRMILHYMQPHGPFIPFSDVHVKEVSSPGVGEDYGMTVAELAEEAGYSRDEMWEFHVENLRCVLDDLEVLLWNLDDDRVVISADHGQALGEGGVWGHPWGSTLDCLRTVPWCVTTASDSREYDPEYEYGRKQSNLSPDEKRSVEEKLRYLGYKSD